MKKSKPYGAWPSEIDANSASKALTELNYLQSFDGVLFWTENRAQENGRCVIVCQDKHGNVSDVLPAPFSHGSKVHEYGGIAYTVFDRYLYFVNAKDQRIYSIDLSKDGLSPSPVTPKNSLRYADLIFDSRHERIIAICEDHSDARSIKNYIVSIQITGGLSEITTLISGSDFYAYPRLNSDNSELCWIQWNHPNMPWDHTGLWTASNEKIGITNKKCIVKDKSEQSITQPCWSSKNEIFYISDSSGWWNIYRENNNSIQQTMKSNHDYAEPFWQFGTANYCVLDNGDICFFRSNDGNWEFGFTSSDSSSIKVEQTDYTSYKSICKHRNGIYAIASGPLKPQEIVSFDSDLNFRTRYKPDIIKFNINDISIGESNYYPSSNGELVHAFYYSPKNSQYIDNSCELPPTIFLCHGGPTSAANRSLNFKIQFWTSRGFAVLDINYRGSSGFGREYRARLKNNWGIFDIQDIHHAAKYFSSKSKIDKSRCIIRGSSAGGFTVLSALTKLDIFKTGACLYGIGDLEKLADDTHKFESNYLDSLIGDRIDKSEDYKERSPINHINNLNCPVIFFQGLEDMVVPPNQSQSMVDKLIQKKIKVEYVTFDDEGHGFKKSKNIAHALHRELSFYIDVLCLEV